VGAGICVLRGKEKSRVNSLSAALCLRGESPDTCQEMTNACTVVDGCGPSASVMDLSFLELNTLEDLSEVVEAPVAGRRSKKGQQITSVKLNDNSLEGLDGLAESLGASGVGDLSSIQWLDLSCNNILSLPNLSAFPNVSSINLHGNQIKSLAEVKKLTGLKELRKLTLHGNPLCEDKHYRNYVLHHLQGLKSLDFTAITSRDREAAAVWAHTFRNKLSHQRSEAA
jgi:Leucine-rich repeat (LRR) protein